MPPEVAPPPAAARRVPPPADRRSVTAWLGSFLALALVVWAWHGTEFEPSQLAASLPRLAEFFGRMLPPDWSVARTVMVGTLETLQIAILGTFLAVLASLVLGLMAASNLSPAWLHQPTKWLLGLLRGIPLLLLALIAVAAFGLGPLPGVLTIAIHATGMLGKFYAEAFENADPAPLEALASVGASWAQRIRFAALTQVAPDLVRDTLFRFELNLRESLVLGLVGAGGIGFYIQLYIRAFQYDKVATLTLVVLLMVVAIEQLSVWLRRRLR